VWAVARNVASGLRSLVRLDPASNAIAATTPDGSLSADNISINETSIWAWAGHNGNVVSQLSPLTGETTASIIPRTGTPVAVALDGDDVWIVVADDGDQGHLERVDPTTLLVVARSPSFPLEPNPAQQLYSYAVAGEGVVWVVATDSSLVAVDVSS
jgi:streptogramin lyase